MGFLSSLFGAALIPAIVKLERNLSDRERFDFDEDAFMRSLNQIDGAIRQTESINKKIEARKRLGRLCYHDALNYREKNALVKLVEDLNKNCR